jgi:hypothetical protein
MQRFGYQNIPHELNGENIHRLENVMTLEHTVHKHFDDLKLWFEPTVRNLPREPPIFFF